MSRKSKTLLFFVITLCALASCIIVFSSSFSVKNSSVSINGENLIALNKAAVKGKSSGKNGSMYFGFTENQRVRFSNLMSRNKGNGLKITVSGVQGEFYFGFLYETDFQKEKNIKRKLDSRELVKGSFTQDKKKVSVSFSLPYGHAEPEGFLIHAGNKIKVEDVQFCSVQIGFDETGTVPYYAFGPGGELDLNFPVIDFSNADKLFASKNSNELLMPLVSLGFEPVDSIGTYDNQLTSSVEWGAEKISIRRSPDRNEMTLQTSSLNMPFSRVNYDSSVKKIMMVQNDVRLLPEKDGSVIKPLSTDLGFIIEWPQNNWRCEDYELYSWDLFPSVLFFDFKDYRVQNEFFTRLAYFAEKAGYKGTLVDDDFVENKHGYNAHDYKAEDLAAFFNLVAQTDFPVNSREQLLRRILLENKIIIQKKDGSYKSGTGSVISISRESPEYLRYTFMAHESWHGIFFTNEDFRNFVTMLYNRFDQRSMEFIQTYWETQPGLGYDRNDIYLMHNEFMSYIMQQKLSNVEGYFLQIAGRGTVNQIQPEDAEYIRNTRARAFVKAAEPLNDYAFTHWGLAAGRVNLASRQ